VSSARTLASLVLFLGLFAASVSGWVYASRCEPQGLWEFADGNVRGSEGVLGFHFRLEKRKFRCETLTGSFETTLVREHYVDLPSHLFYFRHPPDRPSVLLITRGVDSRSLETAARLIQAGAVDLLLLQEGVELDSELLRRVPLVLRVSAGGQELMLGTPTGLPWYALTDLLYEFNVGGLHR